MAKKLKWNLILMSVLYLALGVFLLLVPGTALNVVCYALGAVVLVCAVIQLVRYFAVERGIFQSQLTLISGLICLGLGAFLIFRQRCRGAQRLCGAGKPCWNCGQPHRLEGRRDGLSELLLYEGRREKGMDRLRLGHAELG